jgi:hypothetical protein
VIFFIASEPVSCEAEILEAFILGAFGGFWESAV